MDRGARGRAVPLARLRAGDAVLDATRQGTETLVLLARPDAMGSAVAQSITRVVVPDGARPTEAVRNARDPFADPIGHARGTALWARVSNAPALVYDERNTLRIAEVSSAQLRSPRSALEVLPGGGEVLSSSWSADARWLALSTGYADEQHASLRAVTLAAIDQRGEAAVTARLPDDPNAIAEGTVIGANGDRVVVLHPRNEPRGGITWAWVEATCSRTGGGR